ncbi:LuxR family transcriptional regulator [Novosphingobium sp. PhB55]|nr:LuxR family transcriptional regulator [Novosphingobium sp. PhB55]
MHVNSAFDDFVRAADSVKSLDELQLVLEETATRLGYDYFALTHHVDWRRNVSGAIRLHNYPSSWVDFFDENGLGTIDPVQRTSEFAGFGFRWAAAKAGWSERDNYILALAEGHGIRDGYTVPFQMPGEFFGSCTFAVRPGKALPAPNLTLTYLIGRYAFEAARRMAGPPGIVTRPGTRILTDRQHDVTVLVARGMTNKEGGRHLGISPFTFREHVSDIYERLGAHDRVSLTLRAILNCEINFSQLLP